MKQLCSPTFTAVCQINLRDYITFVVLLKQKAYNYQSVLNQLSADSPSKNSSTMKLVCLLFFVMLLGFSVNGETPPGKVP